MSRMTGLGTVLLFRLTTPHRLKRGGFWLSSQLSSHSQTSGMTGLTDALARMVGRPALIPGQVGFGLPLAQRRLNFTRSRPQERVRTRAGRLSLTHIEFVVHHKAGQPSGENIALDRPHTTVADMPAQR